MPFYRQIKQLAHLGMNGLKEATITGWLKRSMELLRPLCNALVKEILKSDYCQADETTTNVINPEKHAKDRKYVWMIRSVTEKLVAFFDEEGPDLEKLSRILQTNTILRAICNVTIFRVIQPCISRALA